MFVCSLNFIPGDRPTTTPAIIEEPQPGQGKLRFVFSVVLIA